MAAVRTRQVSGVIHKPQSVMSDLNNNNNNNNNNSEDLLKARIQKHQGKPLLFHDKCPGFFYLHYTTHRTHSFTSHPRDEEIVVKCLAQ